MLRKMNQEIIYTVNSAKGLLRTRGMRPRFWYIIQHNCPSLIWTLIIWVEIPYDLQSLKAHFESAHPKCMKTFQQGWKNIEKPIQEWWLSQARKGLTNQIDKYRRPNHFTPPSFFSWNGVLCSALDTEYSRPESPVHRDVTRDIENSLEKAIEASALPIFNIPETSGQKQYSGSYETACSVR